jgi:hypothetical protein
MRGKFLIYVNLHTNLLIVNYPFLFMLNQPQPGHTGYFLKFLIVISVLILAAPISFQIMLAVLGNDFIKKCEFLEILLRHVGVVRFDDLR